MIALFKFINELNMKPSKQHLYISQRNEDLFTFGRRFLPLILAGGESGKNGSSRPVSAANRFKAKMGYRELQISTLVSSNKPNALLVFSCPFKIYFPGLECSLSS